MQSRPATRPAHLVPFTAAIPALFTPGQVAGNVSCVSATQAQIALTPPIRLEQDQVLFLTSASVPYSQPNIGPASAGIPGYVAGNNRISVAWNGGARTDYTIPQGLYTVNDVTYALNVIAVAQGWQVGTTPLFDLVGVAATQTVTILVNPAACTGGAFPAGASSIDFLNPGAATPALNDSLGPILGFPTSGGGATLALTPGSTTVASFTAPAVANFALYSAYALYGTMVSYSVNQGNQGQLISTFPLGGAEPNSVFTFLPTLKFRVPVQAGTYSNLVVWTTDQSGNALPLVNYQAPFAFTLQIEDAKRVPKE